MRKILDHEAFRTIKAMHKSGWTRATIIRRSGWSAKTVQRVLQAKTLKQYRLRVYNEVETIRVRRIAARGPQYIDMPVLDPRGRPHLSGLTKLTNAIKGALPWNT